MSLRPTFARLICPSIFALALVGCGDDGVAGSESDTDAETGSTGEGGSATDAGATESDGGSGTDSGTDSSTGGEDPSPFDGEPLPDAGVGEWIWVDFPDAFCRDGSNAGIAVRYGLENKLMFFFEGGGACFNSLSCGANPDSFSASDFETLKNSRGVQGIMNPDNPDNPVAEWSVVYVPYCTGDVHSGESPDTSVPGVGGAQQFVGYSNVEAYLERVYPTFKDAEHVLVTGVSAGGFGAALNYDRIADNWKGEVTLIDDSGPPMADEYLPACLQSQWRDLWKMAIPLECSDCFQDDGGGLVNLVRYIGAKHSDSILALISSEEDEVIRFFFGFGGNDCNALIPSMDAALFKEGLYDLRDNGLKADGSWGSFIHTGSQHTWIGDNGLYSAETGGMLLIDWITDILVRSPQHVAP